MVIGLSMHISHCTEQITLHYLYGYSWTQNLRIWKCSWAWTRNHQVGKHCQWKISHHNSKRRRSRTRCSTLPSPTVSERNRAVPSGSECFRVFPSVSDHISTKFRAFPSGSQQFRAFSSVSDLLYENFQSSFLINSCDFRVIFE